MYCESCHERLKTGARRCPSCGHAAQGGRDLGSASVRDTANPTAYSLPPVPKLVKEEPKAPSAKAEAAKSAPRPPVRRVSPAERPARAPGSAPAPSRGQPSFDLSRDGVIDLLSAHPDMIEKGLRVHAGQDGAPVGARFATSVGRIDLLARDSASGWVIVLVAKSRQGKDLVGDLLQLMGWVRKHLSAEGQEIRAIVLVDEVPEGLEYAAAAISDTVEFKRYRVGLTLDKIDV